ncbi:MAG: LOG family protein, partial [Burkholderiaceae bacterium]
DDCDAFIALPGGYGTMLEILTVIQLLQVRHMEDKPLILVGSMWQDIMSYASNRMWRNRFIGDTEQYFHWNAMTPTDAAERLLKAT